MHQSVHDIETTTLNDERAETRHQNGGRDGALFAAFLAGDDRALVALFDRHNERLFRYCIQFVGTAARAEDITQELWERIIRLRRDGRGSSENPAGLFLRIVRNLCIDEIRRTRPHSSLEVLAEEHHPATEIPELTHLEELVLLALPHLPAEQKEILILHEYSGYGYDEIAAMLGESVGAIRTRAWRARTHLGRVVSAMLGMRRDAKDDRDRGLPQEEE
jgi:RNA polymerase sigma-70 factor (ECF subfamily)